MHMLLGNRRYSSWSLRGWLAARQSGLAIAEIWLNIYAEDWQQRRAEPDLAVAGGKVPVLHDGPSAIWNSIGIIDWLDRASGGTRFWPTDGVARAWGISVAVEMQAGFMALRQHCPMNMMRHYPGWQVADAAKADIARVDHLWSESLARFGGPWLLGAHWGAADIMYAPVASRLTTYDVALSDASNGYSQRAMDHPLMQEWITAAAQETVIQPAYEF